MTVSEFLAWAEKQPRGRYELWNGQPVEMSPERVRHAKMKYVIAKALEAGIRRAELPCHMLPDGMTVRIDDRTAFEPDALVYCGPELAGDDILVPSPMVIVEVLSPGTASIDTGLKFESYFSLSSVMHYLIVSPDRRVLTHHARRTKIETDIIREGEVRLDPPGLVFRLDEIFGQTRLAPIIPASTAAGAAATAPA